MGQRLNILNPQALANYQPNHAAAAQQMEGDKNAFGMQNNQNFNMQNAP